MALIKVEVISDVICPWCYIGYRSLQKAISLYQKTYPGGSNDKIEVWWKPYFLDQEAPKETITMQDRMLRRMEPKMVAAAQTRLKRVGAGVGIHFKFGGYIGSSRPAHQLLYMAGRDSSEQQCRVSEMLFHYQFEREADITKLVTLVEVGVAAGLQEKDIREWLASGVGAAEIEQEAKKARADGRKGVPHFVIGGKYHLEGAVDMSELFETFVKVREEDKGCRQQ
ncbi:hypothetical protein BBP40_006632 [Aspergillus hancockii]|nr:hypothetical protein BBP40_006632 [Aspergillus hancockii]